jgi:membrane protein
MLERIILRIKRSPILFKIYRWAQRVVLPGFAGISLYDSMSFFIKGIQKGSVTTRAGALAFNFFMALFPTIIFIFTLIPYIPIKDFQNTLLETIALLMPENAFEATSDTITEIVTKQNGGLLSVGFFLALYFSTNGFHSMIGAFNKTIHTIETRKPLMQRLISILLVFLTTILLVLGMGSIVLSEIVLHKLFDKRNWDLTAYVISGGRWVILFGFYLILISMIYRLAPAKKKAGIRFVSPGAMLATFLSLITSLGFAFYVNNFGNFNKVYGSLGTLMVVMMWIYLNSLVLLLGFELNASIHFLHKRKQTAS